jgi:hypothetical protein
MTSNASAHPEGATESSTTLTVAAQTPPSQPARRTSAQRTVKASPGTPMRGSRPTLLDDIFADLHHHLDEVEDQARGRREPRSDDPVADGMEYAIKQLRDALAEIDTNHEYLSAEQYGDLHGGVSPQTVCGWCRSGELDGIETPTGWRIKRGVQRQRKRRTA